MTEWEIDCYHLDEPFFFRIGTVDNAIQIISEPQSLRWLELHPAIEFLGARPHELGLHSLFFLATTPDWKEKTLELFPEGIFHSHGQNHRVFITEYDIAVLKLRANHKN